MSRTVTYSDDKKKEYAGRLLGGIIAFCMKKLGVPEDVAGNIGEEVGVFLTGVEVQEDVSDTVEKHWNDALDRMWIKIKKEKELPEEFWSPLENELFRTEETMVLFLAYFDMVKATDDVSVPVESLRLIIEAIHKDSAIVDTETIPEDLSEMILSCLKEEVKKDLALYNYIQTFILRVRLAENGLLGKPGNGSQESLPMHPSAGLIEYNADNNQNTQSDRSKINLNNRKKAVDHEYNTPVINIFRERMTWGVWFQNELYRPQQFIVRKNITIHNADELLEKYRQANLLITGEAGYGKTAAFEYLFLKYGLNEETPVYYLPAYIFTRGKDDITHLQKAIRNLLEAGEKVDGLLLIDGFEEAYLNNYKAASSKIKLIADSGTIFWIACRADFYENLDLESDGYFQEIAHVKKWERDDFNEFVSKYEHYYLYYDDVTNLCKVALRTYSRSAKSMYGNMFQIYKQTYELNSILASSEAREIISKYNELQLLSLRDEIIYYTLRLPDAAGICREFVEYALAHINGNIMISLGLAYGLAAVMPHPYTLEFARKMTPGSPEDLRNRSWALVFFGDVPGYGEYAGYTYEDDGTSKWVNIRRMRWDRLRKNTPSYYRNRILDLPFLYCFYASRGFKDCNSLDDLTVIENCDISNYGYTAEEREFLVEQKRMLVEAYRGHLTPEVI